MVFLVGLIGLSVCVALLEAWPLAVLIDTVLSETPSADWVHRAFVAVLPESRLRPVEIQDCRRA
jgi:ATP-binding cassette, subfamily B, bacterial